MTEPASNSTPPNLALIAAVARNGVIGRCGGLPWKLPQDMRWFVRKTTGHAVIMGRRDYEHHNTPLPNRRNILMTRQAHYEAPGIEVVHSLDEALALLAGRQPGDADNETDGPSDGEPFVIGGGEIYSQALPRAQRMYLTHIDAEVDGDVFFPAFDPGPWDVTTLWSHPADEKHFAGFTVKCYDRRQFASGEA